MNEATTTLTLRSATVQFIHCCCCCRLVHSLLYQSSFPLCWVQQNSRLRDLLNTGPVHASRTVALFLRHLRLVGVAILAETETVFLSKLQIAPCSSSSCGRVKTWRQSTVLVHVVARRTSFLLATAAEPTIVIELQKGPCSLCSSSSRVTTRHARNIVPVLAKAWKTQFLRRPRLVRVASVEKAGRTAVELLSKLSYSRGLVTDLFTSGCPTRVC